MRAHLPQGLCVPGTVLALGLALWTTSAGPAIANSPAECGCNLICGCNSVPFPRDPWYVGAEAIALQRTFAGLGPAATLGVSPSGSVALSQESLDQPFQGGVQMLVGHTFGDSPFQVEMSYFWLNPMLVTAQATDPNDDLYSPFTKFGANTDPRFDNNSLVEIRLASRLEGGEFNLKSTLALPEGDPTLVFLFGLRHLAIREEFQYASVSTTNASQVSVNARTSNNLWGPQIGGLVEYGQPDLWFRFEGKAAICNNDFTRDLESAVNGAGSVHPRLGGSGTALVGDIKAAVLWRPTSALTARFGYQMLWVDQVALAARNFAPDVDTLTNALAQPAINARGTLIYHGPFAGLQLSW